MSSTAQHTVSPTQEWLEERIRAHKEEVARLREELGDPQGALFQFITERFEVQALIPDEQLKNGSRNIVLEEEDDDLNGW